MSALLMLLSGCGELGDSGVDCTAEAVLSLALRVEDSQGPVEGLTVEYAMDGEDFRSCEDFGGGDYGCGWEQAGTMAVRIEADGYEPFSTEVEIGADECHVITEDLGVLLVDEPVDG